MVVKQKIAKSERLKTTIAIERILENHCRPCELDRGSTRHTKPQCLSCVHYKDLRELGKALGMNEAKEEIFSDEILQEAEKNGISRTQLLARYRRGMPMSQIASKRVQVQKLWTAEDDKKLLELHAAGTDIREMTEVLNRSMEPIRKRLRFLRNN